MSNSLFIDIHILQNVPPSNINRDDTGSPKTARFGGVIRSRISSQAWKKATRDLFPSYLLEDEIGWRTKHVVDLISGYAAIKRPDLNGKNLEDASAKALGATGIKVTDKDTGYLLFLSPKQAESLADLAIASIEENSSIDKKAAKDVLNIKQRPTLNAIDIALFGRMVADAPDLNVDAAVQVAHAISVGRAETEFDYFTALDDQAPEDNAGAAMIETTEFTSSTLYRYADIDVHHLCENLGSAAAACRGIEAFLNAFVRSMPTGKQNSFANRTLPAAVIVELRERQPVSLVNAFEKPISTTQGKSQTERACEELVVQERVIDEAFDIAPKATFVTIASPDAHALEDFPNAQIVDFNTLISRVSEECASYLAGNGYSSEEQE
ncbi:type I-E CRISPR-associated protein Cas7/Cse4/CasC [Lancefieldella sp. Marseille-Q7238]|uniref:type I-E CRISPR-associated protein Cas7/Cse4/CasC n=1 Tax=Lancefieldella sp. Marseille-Q7238 TaxID=3022127 RepID=UPI0024A9D111|nr:type I-E CRISPR-associated protein Cas7/Cse4/CasC [Lancefieldella sp. Marseille-Q7238]